jgi:hypothetical protein
MPITILPATGMPNSQYQMTNNYKSELGLPCYLPAVYIPVIVAYGGVWYPIVLRKS